MEVSVGLSEKAPSPMSVILSGSFIPIFLSVNFFWKALLPILVTPETPEKSRSVPASAPANLFEPSWLNLSIVLPDIIKSVLVYCTGVAALATIDRFELSENNEQLVKLSDLRGGGEQGKGTGCY